MRHLTTAKPVRHFLLLALGLLLVAGNAAALPTHDSQGQALPSLAPMLDKVTPAVVNIATTGTVRVRGNPLLDDPFFRRFFDMPEQPRERRTQSLGSGVIVDADNGYILTNNHVIEHADQIKVTLRNGSSYDAELIGTDPDSDVAVIKIEADNLTAVPLADSDSLRVGDFVVAIGNPFGLGQTVTSGIVSALDRSGLGIQGYEDFIQTDASINPGNSGGALVNLNGELIGINNAIFSRSGGNIGIGFAIPINMAQKIMAQLVEHGEVRRGRLGAQAQDLTPELAQAFGLKQGEGAVITQVNDGSPADRAGLQPGDIVTAIDGKPVRDANTLRNSIGLLPIGSEVRIQVLREGKQHALTATIEKPASQQAQGGEKLHAHLTGARFSDITEGHRLHGRIEGVLVSEVERGSPAWSAGLRPNDVIVSVNRQPIKSVADMRDVIGNSPQLLLNIRRGNGALFLYLR
ncbi:DegQ family serine endoprotease [Thiohalophilus sp.]|uniref:DegQ family serine endoprotease n=1 Tax=Thiohalophilus sp. TaxID=3028392 RepID=UPI002ACE5BD5|nr:DegQ family serine endoprotease [Thiohalophilus sp.]MDZ7805474.1 DegQ family serine endoprotease [Thiohalophilus sp.]